MSKNKASFALWEAGHRTLSKNLKNLTMAEFKAIFGDKKEQTLISKFLSKNLQGHSGELLGKLYFLIKFLSIISVFFILLINIYFFLFDIEFGYFTNQIYFLFFLLKYIFPYLILDLDISLI